GVLKFLDTARMSQGVAVQSMDVWKTGPVVDQSRLPPETLTEDAAMFPLAPGIPVEGAVGITLIPAVDPLFTPFWPRKSERCGISYMIPPPARTTVFPLPPGSQDMPNRGAKLLWSPLYGALMPCPTW